MSYDPELYIPTQRETLSWYSVDLDGTLAEGVFPHSQGIGEPIIANLVKLEEVREAGFKVNIHTARSWNEYESVDRWLNDHDIEFRRIIMGKPLCHRYVDDRAISAFDESWVK